MSFYCILNLVLALGTSFWLERVFFKERYLFVKPSVILLTYTHIFFQWPMALLPGYCEHSLKNPYTLSFLINGYMLCGLLISPLILREKAQIIWNKLDSKSLLLNSEYYYFSITFLLSIVFLVSVLYFSFFSFNKTGLYAIFFNPVGSEMARENSLKLLDSQGLKYLYSIARSSVVPLLFSLVFLQILMRWRTSHFNSKITYFEMLILLLCAFFSSLTGERSFLAYLVLLGGFVILWENKLKFQPVKTLLIILLSAAPPLLFTFFRSGGIFSNFNFFLYVFYLGDIFERILVVPFKVGVWYVQYVQDVGPFGIAAFEKLSKIFGISPLNAPNIVGLKYAPEFYQGGGSNFGVKSLQKTIDVYNLFDNQPISSKDVLGNLPSIKASVEARKNISAGAGYLLSYYGYLGILSFPISLLGLFFLDIALLFYMRIKDIFLIPCLAAISLVCLEFVQTDYTVTWVTHGYGALLLLTLGISKGLGFVNKQFVWRGYGQPRET